MSNINRLTILQRVSNAKRVIEILQNSKKNGGFQTSFLSKMYLLLSDIEQAYKNAEDPETLLVANTLLSVDNDGKHGV